MLWEVLEFYSYLPVWILWLDHGEKMYSSSFWSCWRFACRREFCPSDNYCQQFGSRSGLTFCLAWSGSKLFDTLIVFKKYFCEKVILKKYIHVLITEKTMKNYPACKELMVIGSYLSEWSHQVDMQNEWLFKNKLEGKNILCFLKKMIAPEWLPSIAFYPRRSWRDIVLASRVCPSIRPHFLSVQNHISVPIGQIWFIIGTNDKYHGLSISYKFRQNQPLNTRVIALVLNYSFYVFHIDFCR